MLRGTSTFALILRCLIRAPLSLRILRSPLWARCTSAIRQSCRIVRRTIRTAHGCPEFGASSESEIESALFSKQKSIKNEQGQALIEFILLIPIVLIFVWYLVHINVAINKSIVGQKHVRSQLFLKMFNHRSGPMLSEFAQTKRSHFYIGVSDDVVSGDVRPKAPTEMIGIGPNPRLAKDMNDEPGEPSANSPRQRVRIRTVFGICTHRKKSATGLSDFCATEHQ